jgi:hypothetical protein
MYAISKPRKARPGAERHDRTLLLRVKEECVCLQNFQRVLRHDARSEHGSAGTTILYKLIATRYEKTATILTSNKGPHGMGAAGVGNYKGVFDLRGDDG